jgi:exonuclease III
MRQRNIGWRLDLILASRAIADTTTSCVVQREVGTSDHGPVIAVFDGGPSRPAAPNVSGA